MRALYRSLLVTTLCVAVSVFMFAGVSQAKKGGSSGSKVKIEVRAELEPIGTSEPDAEGQARHKKETRTKNEVITIKKDEFKATVNVPVPSLGLGITDEASAENADIRLILSHDGADFAECLLEFDEVEDEDGEDQAEYKVDVRIKKGAVQAKKGVCDVDLVTTDIQSGVPDARANDVATARLVAGGTSTDFLQGTFEVH